MAQPELIHIIFKTHLDVGFTDFADNVIQKYFSQYIPQAIETARLLREQGGEERFIWTTGSWLISEYMEKAAPEDAARLEEAIRQGDITWHALPFTTHTELMDASLFDYALSLSRRLDEHFGRKTVAAKLTDVPGHTIAMVPHLAKAGVQFLHIGVNGASTVPEVPPVFRWRAADGSEVIVMYHGSYGDLMQVPGMNEAIYFAFTNDNLGPLEPDDVRFVYQILREQYPDSRLVASTMDAYAGAIAAANPELPVLTAEIGDTWIHGVGTDPEKVAQFRALQRRRTRWLEEGALDPSSPALERFSNLLLLVAEHTWGMDMKTFLENDTHFLPEDLRLARNHLMFERVEASWDEQRDYLRRALAALEDTGLSQDALSALEKTRAQPPDTTGFEPVEDLDRPFEAGPFTLRFDPATGALISLMERAAGREWAGPDNPLGLFRCQSFSQQDYDRFFRQYIRTEEEWAARDFGKPGMDQVGASGGWLLPQVAGLWRKQDAGTVHFLLRLDLSPPAGSATGCPQRVTIEITAADEDDRLQFTVQWFNKPATRLPEAIWYSFVPAGLSGKGWTLEKMDSSISPLDVVPGGARKLHAISDGVFYEDGPLSVSILSADAPLVAPGEPSLLNFDDRLPDLSKGMHFNLYNNVWGTNFPAWYDNDARFRFVFSAGSS